MIYGGIKKASFASLALLLILGAAFLDAPNIGNAYADKFDLRVHITPQISLTTSTNTVSMSVLPDPSGSFTSNNVTATVSTNSATGYSLIMSTKGNDANLVDVDDEESVIPSNFSGSVTSSTMSLDTWGYSLDGTNYYAVPLANNAAAVNSSNAAIEQHSATVFYGAKISSNTKPGTYEDTVIFTAIANSDIVPASEYTIYDITYMQEMSPLVCENTTTPSSAATDFIWNKSDDDSYVPRTSLIDSRDGTVYIISKMPDGTCWMSQNLDFELDSEGVTDEDTDLNSVEFWIPENETHEWNDEIDWQGDDWDTDRSIKPPVSQKMLQGGTTPSSVQSNSSSSYRWERVGIYYNWKAVTAGLSHDFSEITEDSICPKNWTLPSTEQLESMVDMLDDSGVDHANEKPFNMLYSGYVNSFGGDDRSIIGAGGDSGQVSFWGSNDGEGMMITYEWGGARTQDYYKDVGLTVRCVARQ